ncbi:MAG: hypothetical protein WCD79_03305, partial [Chthoniobacteraceae bacterium]
FFLKIGFFFVNYCGHFLWMIAASSPASGTPEQYALNPRPHTQLGNMLQGAHASRVLVAASRLNELFPSASSIS